MARCAAAEAGIDPRSLLALGGEGTGPGTGPGTAPPPPCFADSTFQYVHPASFGHALPTFDVPEVAFLGRSNVGKSSLVNALTGGGGGGRRRDLARTSKKPGRTQQVNYFALVRWDRCVAGGGGGGGGEGEES